MWQVAGGGGRLKVDEYDIYYILKINVSSVMFTFIVTGWGGAMRAGYQQSELQERHFFCFCFCFSVSRSVNFVVLSVTPYKK